MHWINNLLFYALGFVTAMFCVLCSTLIIAAEREDKESVENYERWRKINLEFNDIDRLDEIERREVR
jgi:hypothetical protein